MTENEAKEIFELFTLTNNFPFVIGQLSYQFMIPFQPVKNSQKIYDLMLKHILQHQRALNKVTSATQTLPLSSLGKGRGGGKPQTPLDRA